MLASPAWIRLPSTGRQLLGSLRPPLMRLQTRAVILNHSPVHNLIGYMGHKISGTFGARLSFGIPRSALLGLYG